MTLATLERPTDTELSTTRELPQAGTQIATTRAAQEVQAAMIVAKKYPRDETAAFSRIMQACKRKGLAESAVYAYPRGGQTVSGPSIRMAEVLAQSWGNLDFGIIELENKNHESQVMAYAWDLETNTRQTKVFSVKHERHTREGSRLLTDPRDIYEMVANQGARRMRACILGVIPGDVIDAAVAECEKTMAGGNGEPLIDRIRKMVAAFAEKGVTVEMIERKLQHPTATIIEAELVTLRKIYTSIKDGIGKVTDYFEQGGTVAPEGKSKSDVLADQLQSQMQQSKPKTETPNPPDETQPADSAPNSTGDRTAESIDWQKKIDACTTITALRKIEDEAVAAVPMPERQAILDGIAERTEQIKKARGSAKQEGSLV